MTYDEFVHRVAARSGLSRELAERSVEAILEELADAGREEALGAEGPGVRVTRRPALNEISHGQVIRFRPRPARAAVRMRPGQSGGFDGLPPDAA